MATKTAKVSKKTTVTPEPETSYFADLVNGAANNASGDHAHDEVAKKKSHLSTEQREWCKLYHIDEDDYPCDPDTRKNMAANVRVCRHELAEMVTKHMYGLELTVREQDINKTDYAYAAGSQVRFSSGGPYLPGKLGPTLTKLRDRVVCFPYVIIWYNPKEKRWEQVDGRHRFAIFRVAGVKTIKCYELICDDEDRVREYAATINDHLNGDHHTDEEKEQRISQAVYRLLVARSKKATKEEREEPLDKDALAVVHFMDPKSVADVIQAVEFKLQLLAIDCKYVEQLTQAQLLLFQRMHCIKAAVVLIGFLAQNSLTMRDQDLAGITTRIAGSGLQSDDEKVKLAKEQKNHFVTAKENYRSSKRKNSKRASSGATSLSEQAEAHRVPNSKRKDVMFYDAMYNASQKMQGVMSNNGRISDLADEYHKDDRAKWLDSALMVTRSVYDLAGRLLRRNKNAVDNLPEPSDDDEDNNE